MWLGLGRTMSDAEVAFCRSAPILANLVLLGRWDNPAFFKARTQPPVVEALA